MYTLYFVRHGETDYNKNGIVQGSGVDSSINAKGERQALAFFHRYQAESFDGLYVSTLQRTHQTMSPWLNLGYDLTPTPALNELGWGTHEGVAPTPPQREAFQQMLLRWQQGHLHESVEAGESPIEAWNRAEAFFTHLLSLRPVGKYLLCSHGRQLRVILSNLLGVGMTEMERYRHQNTGLTIVQLSAIGQGHLLKLNDRAHLNLVS